jgi:hypothetical protein
MTLIWISSIKKEKRSIIRRFKIKGKDLTLKTKLFLIYSAKISHLKRRVSDRGMMRCKPSSGWSMEQSK